MELIAMDQMLSQGKEECEFSIEQLTSEQIGPLISNASELLNMMLKYQEQILTAIAIIEPFTETLKQKEKEAYKQFETQRKGTLPTKKSDVMPPLAKPF